MARTDPGEPVVLARRLLEALGGRFSTEMGIDLDGGDEQIERWLLASTLFGARISASTAVRTYRELAGAGITTPAEVRGRSWNQLVEVLDRGGYARYDFQTATRLQKLAEALRGRGVDSLRDGSLGETRANLDALPGWGPVTVSLFLRELRGVWPEVDPPLDKRAADAAQHLGLLAGDADALEMLRSLAGRADVDLRDLEAGLVRLWLSHRRTAANCPGGLECLGLAGRR